MLPAAASQSGSAPPLVDVDGRDQHGSHHHLLPERLDTDDHESVLQRSWDENADDAAEDGPVLVAAEPSERRNYQGEPRTHRDPGLNAQWVLDQGGDVLKFFVQMRADRPAPGPGSPIWRPRRWPCARNSSPTAAPRAAPWSS